MSHVGRTGTLLIAAVLAGLVLNVGPLAAGEQPRAAAVESWIPIQPGVMEQVRQDGMTARRYRGSEGLNAEITFFQGEVARLSLAQEDQRTDSDRRLLKSYQVRLVRLAAIRDIMKLWNVSQATPEAGARVGSVSPLGTSSGSHAGPPCWFDYDLNASAHFTGIGGLTAYTGIGEAHYHLTGMSFPYSCNGVAGVDMILNGVGAGGHFYQEDVGPFAHVYLEHDVMCPCEIDILSWVYCLDDPWFYESEQYYRPR